jgi:CysZ protein
LAIEPIENQKSLMNAPQTTSLVLHQRPGFRAGLRALFDGYRYLLRTPEVWPLAIVPIFVALVLATGFGIGAVKGALWLVAKNLTGDHNAWYWPILSGFFQIVAVVIGLVSALFLAFALAKPISGPVLERIVRRVSTDLGAPAWPTPTLMQDILRSLQSTLVAVAFIAPIMVPLAIVGVVVPTLSVITTPLQFVLAAIGAAWDFCDYPLSIRGTPVGVRIEFVRRNKRAVMGFGLGLALLLLLPCTLLVVLPAGVIGAAHLTVVLERWEEAERQRLAGKSLTVQ